MPLKCLIYISVFELILYIDQELFHLSYPYDLSDFLNTALQIVADHRSLPTIWVSWSIKIDADFLK